MKMTVVANPDPTPRIASVHKSQIRRGCACGMLDGGLFTTVYYYVNGKTRLESHCTRRLVYWGVGSRALGVMHGPYTWRTWLTRDQYVHACKAEDDVNVLMIGKILSFSWEQMCYFKVIRGDSPRFDGLSLRFWQKTNSFAMLTRV